MKKFFAFLILALLAFPVLAADTKVTGSVEHTDFSNDFGQRSVVQLESISQYETGSVVFNVAHGERKVDGGPSFEGQRISGQFYKNWSDGFYTRTQIGLASDSPVFARRDFAQDFNIKVASPTVLLLGLRHTKYFEDVTVKAYTVGVTHYFNGRFNASYRFTRYDSDRTGSNNGNLVMLRLKDAAGEGTTQMWLGYADTLYGYEWLPEIADGRQKSVVLRRVQPLGNSLALNALVGKTWYETPVVDYNGLQVGLGLSLDW